jgi:hypothetical protein
MKSHRSIALKFACVLGAFAFACPSVVRAQDEEPVFPEFQDTFPLHHCKLAPWGLNPFFPLVPGYQLLLEGEDDGEVETVLITVLHRTRVVQGVRCAIVEEREWVDGELVEVSRNFFAICRTHGDVFYFGEDVDDYEDGEIVGHGGAWLAGKNGARFGLMMPGYPLVGSRYYQEIAPGVAEDRAEHLSVTESIVTPAGTFKGCLLVEETEPSRPDNESIKTYAPFVGLVQDEHLLLIDFGFHVRPSGKCRGGSGGAD